MPTTSEFAWSPAAALALAWSGSLLLTGLLLGVWKYAAIRRSPQAVAPEYVSIAHRAALMYAYACAVLAGLCQRNALPVDLQRLCVWGMAGTFVMAIASYVLHGALNDTDNQFRPPHRLGPHAVHGGVVDATMVLKAAVELLALAALLWGFARANL